MSLAVSGCLAGRVSDRSDGCREASGIGTGFKAADYYAFSTFEHLKRFLSGSGYSISAVQLLTNSVRLATSKVAYESLSERQFVPARLDIRANHARVFRLLGFSPDLMRLAVHKNS